MRRNLLKCSLFTFMVICFTFALSQDVVTLSTITRADSRLIITNQEELENAMEIQSRPKETINQTSGNNLTFIWTFIIKTDKIIDNSLVLTGLSAEKSPIDIYSCNDTKNKDETRAFRCSATEVAKNDKRYEGRLQSKDMLFYYSQFQSSRMELPLYNLDTISDNRTVFTMTVNNLQIFNTTLYVADMEEMRSLVKILTAVAAVAGAVFVLCCAVFCVNMYFDEGLRSKSKRNLVATTKKHQNV